MMLVAVPVTAPAAIMIPVTVSRRTPVRTPIPGSPIPVNPHPAGTPVAVDPRIPRAWAWRTEGCRVIASVRGRAADSDSNGNMGGGECRTSDQQHQGEQLICHLVLPSSPMSKARASPSPKWLRIHPGDSSSVVLGGQVRWYSAKTDRARWRKFNLGARHDFTLRGPVSRAKSASKNPLTPSPPGARLE